MTIPAAAPAPAPRRPAHLAPEPRSCPIPQTIPPQLTGKYSYICNKNATRPKVRGLDFFPGPAGAISAQPGSSVDKWWISTENLRGLPSQARLICRAGGYLHRLSSARSFETELMVAVVVVVMVLVLLFHG